LGVELKYLAYRC